jgi:chorismate mutase/prephenate dehydratase
MNDKLHSLRLGIDTLDEKIQTLISARAALVKEVGQIKQELGESADCYRPEREAEILRKVAARNQGPLSDEDLTYLFRELMSVCRALEQPMRVAYLGPEGTFTQTAALKHFGHSVQLMPQSSIEQVFHDVEAGAMAYGVVPVENSSEGVVNHTLDMFMTSPLRISGEIELRIHHHLLGHMEDLKSVTCVYAHQQALAQCRRWLDAHLPGVERMAVRSNAEGARRAAQETGVAAIAGNNAAEIYQLKVLAADIEDEANNTTRFLVIGRQSVPPSGHDKTSLMISTGNRPGALYHLLQPFARHNISLTRIESRPSRQAAWDYVFFVDLDGHSQDPDVAEALKELGAEASFVKVLGSYPRAIP